MKKILFFILALLLPLCGGTAWAQTDVTSKYLTNAGFDTSSSWQTSNVAAGGSANSIDVDGWTVAKSATWSSSAAFGYGGGGQINGADVPASGADGSTTGGALGISTGWGGICKYTQAVTLPAGKYKISYAAYNNLSGVFQSYNYIGFESTAKNTYGTIHNFLYQTWMTDAIYLNLTEETTGNIAVGLGGVSGGSGGNAKVFIDYIKIEAYNAAESTMPGSTVTAGSWSGNTGTYQSTYPEYYSTSHFTGDAMTNTTTVDNGNYDIDVAFQSHMAWIGQVATDGTQNSYITAEAYTLPVGIVNNTGFAGYEPTTYHLENVLVTDGSLDIKVGNSANGGNWLTVGTPTITQMTTPYVSYGAFALPSGNTTAGFWYAYDVPISGKYKITSSAATTLTYTQTATDLITAGTSVTLSANTASGDINLTQGKLYLSSSAAATLSIEASSYSYQTGEATTDISYVQGGETVSVSYSSANTNDPDASLTINTSGVTFGGNAVTCTATTNGFTFTAPTTTAGQSYTLSIPAGIVAYTGHASNAAQTITIKAPAVFDGTYYLQNEDGDYLSRGSSWGTHAIADAWGQPIEIATAGDGLSTLKFLDSNLYLYNGDSNIWCDGTDPTNTNTKWSFTLSDSKYRLASAQQSGLYVKMDDGDVNLYSDGSDDAVIQNWTLVTPATHTTNMNTLRTSLTALSSQVSGLSSKTYVSATTSSTAEEYQGSTCAGGNTSIVSGSLAVYPGIYKFTIPAFHRIAFNDVAYPSHNEGTECVPVYAYFGDTKVQLHSIYDATTTETKDCWTKDSISFYPNGQSSALTAFKAGSYVNTIWVRVTEASTFSYGIQNQGRPGTAGRWTCYASDGIEITRYYDPSTEALNDGDDVTTLIKNPTIESTNASALPTSWSGNTTSWRWTQGTGNTVMECWNGSASDVSFNMYQTLTGLQEGVYELSAEMFNSSNSDDSALTEAFTGGECGLYASTTDANAYVGVSTDGTTLTKHTLYIYVADNGSLTLGVKNVATPTGRWFAADNFTLKYRTLESAKADLIASIPTDKANQDLKSAMTSASTTLQNTTSGTNFNALTTAIANVRISAANYGHLNYALNQEDARLSSVGDSVQTEYASLVSSYKEDYNNQKPTGDCMTEIHTVKAALAQALVNQKACMTPLILNNSFETGDLTSWTVTYGDDTGVKTNGGTTYATDGGDGTYLFNTWAWGDVGGYPLKQNIGWLPAGTYKLTGLVTSSTGTVFLLANDYTSTGTTPTDKTTFLNASLTFTLSELSEVTIGVAGGNSSGLYDGGNGTWYKADNFQLNASKAKSDEEEEEEETVDGITLTTNSYFARGSENIFGRFSITGTSTTPTEQGLCYSAYKQKPTVSDSTTTDYLSYCGKIFKISDLQASTPYYVRPYAKINGKTYYGTAHKVYTIAKGTITYNIRSSSESEYDTNITNAVSTMVDYWNRYTNISGYTVSAGYVDGVATADCSYGGYIRFGSNTSYQQCGTAMHESLHGIGVGTGDQWSTLCSGKNWTGPRVNEFIKFFENSEGAKLYGDSQHAWCTNGNGGLSYTINGASEDAYSDLQRTADGLLAQAFGEDGLKPTSGAYYFVPYYSIEQEETDVFYIQNSNNGKYLVDGKGTLGTASYASLADAKTAGAGWRFTFNPSTQWYTITSVNYGNKLSHANYSWGINKTDANIAIVESVNSGKYWLNTPTTDGRNLLGDLSCGTTAIVDYSDANGQDWIITRVRNLKGDVDKNGIVEVADVKAIADILLGNDSSAYDTDKADVNGSGEITISDMNTLIEMLNE